jgi:Tfp pilus assembly protein FimT
MTMNKSGTRGFTMIELMFFVATIGIVVGMALFALTGVHMRNDVECQIKNMHTDIMNARILAFQGRRAHFLVVTPNDYQIIEDTNDSGGKSPDRGDTALWVAPRRLMFISQWRGTIIMDANGVMSNSSADHVSVASLDIRFDTSGLESAHNCIVVGTTRIVDGMWDGMRCVEKCERHSSS